MSELRPTKPLPARPPNMLTGSDPPWRNLHQRCDRWLARYLKRRGWVVFWLDEPARFCHVTDGKGSAKPLGELASRGCWLALYESERKAGR